MAAEGRRQGGLSKSCILIIVVASVERFAYKGVASNLVTYLTEHVNLGTSAAAKSVNNWCGVTSMLPLVGAFLADSYWDRYSTILGSSLVYVAGLVALTSWALLCTWMPTASLFLPLYLISVGQGGYNPSLQAFGADQLELGDDLGGKNEETSNKKSLFFQWWYFGICSGSLLGNSIMSYIQDTYGWELGFAIPTVVMAASVACFTAGARCYVRSQRDPEDARGSRPIEDVIRGLKQAVLRRVQKGAAVKLPPKEADVAELELQAHPLCEESGVPDKKVSQPEDTPAPSAGRTILRLLPIWTMLLMFAVIFQLPSTFFTRQGAAMKRNIGSSSFMIPPATLQSSITISIILLMPLYDKVIIPVIRAVTRRDKGITVLQRIGVGMTLSILAMVVAATVEARRLHGRQQMSILWLLPQYVLLGVSDVFTVVGMQEFFYTRVPSAMRTIGIGLYLSVFGVGGFLGSALISVVGLVSAAAGHGWLPDDMEAARLDKYYWLLALLSSVSFVWFVYLCKGYEEDGEVSS